MSEGHTIYIPDPGKQPVDHYKINNLILNAQEAVSMLDWCMETRSYKSLKLWLVDLQKATKELEQEIDKMEVNFLTKNDSLD